MTPSLNATVLDGAHTRRWWPARAQASSHGQDLVIDRCSEPVIERLYRTRQVPLSTGKLTPMSVYIPQEQGDYLYSLVRQVKPKVTVEVGMANGLSTLFIASALRENGAGRHIAIDPFQTAEWKGAGMTVVAQAGLTELVELRESRSHQALPMLEQEGVRVQFAFIDGAHLFDYVISDFLCVDRILDVGGLIAFDDADWPAIRQSLRYILANRAYEVAYPDIVIESCTPTPSLAARFVRSAAAAAPKLASKLNPAFVVPDEELGLFGRCVVLRKLQEEHRDSQTRSHHAF